MKKANLHFMLVSLTVLFVLSQLIFFGIYHQVTDLVDELLKTTIATEFSAPIIFLPVLTYIAIQITAYIIFLLGIFFLTKSISNLFQLKNKWSYLLGLFLWINGIILILSLNTCFYPHSFFATPYLNNKVSLISSSIFIFAIGISYYHFFRCNKKSFTGWFFCTLTLILFFTYSYQNYSFKINQNSSSQPNIIIIGFDSLRPDAISNEVMPHLSAVLANSHVYQNALTPLARTLPAWMSLLTAAYPKHTNIRANLTEDSLSQRYVTLASRLQAAGYETFYGTDESRYTDVTKEHGFNHLIGPKGGAVEFLLGSFYDFPLNNLLLRLPGANLIFPYNYANRAAHITYDPDDFVQLMKWKIENHQPKPLFIALHLTMSHWPFTWARDKYNDEMIQALLYQKSLSTADDQFQKIYNFLLTSGLLNNSILILISDHGVTFGQLNDRWIQEKKYLGDKKDLKLLTRFRLANAANNSIDSHDFALNTSYGQGTDVLSLPQYRILFAIRGYGLNLSLHNLAEQVSTLDIAPTLLNYLRLPELPYADGESLLHHQKKPIFIETADVIDGMEADKINVNSVFKNSINVYRLNRKTGLLYLKKKSYQSLVKHKQRAVIWDDWLLARYPSLPHVNLAEEIKLPKRYKMQFNFQKQQFEVIHGSKIIPLVFKTTFNKPYYVLLNLKTKQWTIHLNNEFAKRAPTEFLLQQMQSFYGDELK